MRAEVDASLNSRSHVTTVPLAAAISGVVIQFPFR